MVDGNGKIRTEGKMTFLGEMRGFVRCDTELRFVFKGDWVLGIFKGEFGIFIVLILLLDRWDCIVGSWL